MRGMQVERGVLRDEEARRASRHLMLAEEESGVSRSILLIDDDTAILTALSEAVADDGLEVRTAASAEAAPGIIGSATAGVVLSDLRMPGMDGGDRNAGGRTRLSS